IPDFREMIEKLFGSYAFGYLNNFRWGIFRSSTYKEVDVVSISSNGIKKKVVSFPNFNKNPFEEGNPFIIYEKFLTIFNAEYNVVADFVHAMICPRQFHG